MSIAIWKKFWGLLSFFLVKKPRRTIIWYGAGFWYTKSSYAIVIHMAGRTPLLL